MTEDDEYDKKLRFYIAISMTHPSLTPTDISKTLNIFPDNAWTAGEKRYLANGNLLPGIRNYSYWNAGEHLMGDRLFFRRMSKLLDTLEQHRNFFVQINETGGTTSITIQLPGSMNIGSSLSLKDMSRLVDMRISLGVEVFPHMREEEPYTMVPYHEEDSP